LRWVDKWACQDGTPEDEEDRRKGQNKEKERKDEKSEEVLGEKMV